MMNYPTFSTLYKSVHIGLLQMKVFAWWLLHHFESIGILLELAFWMSAATPGIRRRERKRKGEESNALRTVAIDKSGND